MPRQDHIWYWLAWLLVVSILIVRLIIAWRVPLGEDEAYYWGWSRHVALGFIDHPPMVAWLIAAFSWLGQSPGAVRSGFVLCGAIAALALNDCASRLARNRVAGVVAALAFSLAPFAIGQALPDAPLIAFWAVSLALTVRLVETPMPAYAVFLGLTLGGALLSKFFGFAIFAGIIAYTLARERRAVWSHGFLAVPFIALFAYAPYLWWNANHHWAGFVYAFLTRNGTLHPALGPVISVISGQLATFSPGLWIAAVATLFAARHPLVAWTAAPLAILIALLSPFEAVQAHWFLGPYTSLCIGIGLAFVHLRPLPRLIWTTASVLPAIATLGLVLIIALNPLSMAQVFKRVVGIHARDNGPFSLFGYQRLAKNAREIADAQRATVMTDNFGLASELAFYADLPAVVIGTDIFGRESRNWATLDSQAQRAIIISKDTLGQEEPYRKQLARACGAVRPGPTLRYSFGSAPAGVYYTIWCDQPRPNAVRMLRWETN